MDHHSTTPCAPEVLAEMLPYFSTGFGNPHARTHANGIAAANVLQAALASIASLINAEPEALTLTSGATESCNLALLGLAAAATDRREIIISAIEHDCVAKAAAGLAQQGFTVKVLPVTPQGFVRAEDIAAAVTDKTLVLSLIAASHEVGTLQPLQHAVEIAHARGALLHSDATQAVGKVPLDVAALGIDLLSFSAHKIYGPAGIGALYVRAKPPVAIKPLMFGGLQQRLRPGSVSLPLAAGFGAACRLALRDMGAQAKRQHVLVESLLDQLQAGGIAIAVNGGRSNILPGLLNVRFAGVDADSLMLALRGEVCASSGAACASVSRKPSAVLKAIGLADEDIAGSLRLTLGRSTTAEEVAYVAARIIDAVNAQTKNAQNKTQSQHDG
ncbi:MAG: cysteine desulfurase family protein [Micavibrio sp.]|nr:cysteine desulfurase family protein [Micavibrio sp.]